MHVQIQKWGNSLAFRIPRTFAKETDIKEGTTVDLGIKEGCLVVTPLKNNISLRDLLKKITPSNIHREINFGVRQGLEHL